MTVNKAITDFIDYYRSLFTNPAGNSTEIVILTAMLVIGVIIFWMLVETAFRGGGAVVSRVGSFRRPRLAAGLILVAVASAGLAAAMAVYSIPANETFCGRLCHSMNPQFQSWRRSAHSGAACVDCHADKGFPQAVTSRFRLLVHGVVPEIGGKYSVPLNRNGDYGRKRVPNKRCESCHERVRDGEVDRSNLRVEHEEHVKTGMRCTSCHNRVAHPGAQEYAPVAGAKKGFEYLDNLSERACFRCHKKGGGTKTVASDCESCHPDNKTVQERESVKKLREMHADRSRWLRGTGHGKTASKVGLSPCTVCHDIAKRCVECHDAPQELN